MKAELMKQKTEAQFTVQDLIPLAMVFVVLGLMLVYAGDIQQDVTDDQVTGEAGCNATVKSDCPDSYYIGNNSLEATQTFADKQGTIAKVVVAAVIIGILIVYFYKRFV